MTIPVPVPDAPQPITTAPAKLVDELREAMSALDTLTTLLPADDEGVSKQNLPTAGDQARMKFPHLDDLTIAAFYAQVALTEASCGAVASCLDLLAMAATHAALAKHLAWSLGTPEAPEPK